MEMLLLALATLAQANPYAAAEARRAVVPDPFAWAIEAQVVPAGGSGRVELRLLVPPQHVVYRDQLEVRVVSAGSLRVGQPEYPPGRVGLDPADEDELREQYDHDVVVDLPLSAPATARGLVPLALELRHQGCWNRLCFPPVTRTETVLVRVREPEAPVER